MTTLGILIALVAVTLSWFIWNRAGRRRKVGLVELFRLILIALAIALMFRPESVSERPSDEQRDLVLLVDRSASMRTPDALRERERVTRDAVAESFLDDEAWEQLNDAYRRVELVHETGDFAKEIARVCENLPDADAIVLVSDGDWDDIRAPSRAVRRWVSSRSSHARLHSVPIGQSSRLPDVELVSLDVPAIAVPNKTVRLPFRLQHWMDRTQPLRVVLEIDGEAVEERVINVASRTRFDEAFTWSFELKGRFEVAVRIRAVDGEWTTENNSLVRRIEVRDEKLRVLLIESQPRWEYRFMRNALLRDPGVEVSCLLFHPKLGQTGQGGADYITEFPETNERLDQYDVVFVGDVEAGDEAGDNGLSDEQCRRLASLVEQQASGLVFLPGPKGRQTSLMRSPLGELSPVLFDESNPRGIGDAKPSAIELTESGRRSLLTRFAEEDQDNWQIWDGLPGFYWHAAAQRAKAGSDVLAVHSENGNQYGRYPLIVTRPHGEGKVLFMGTDSAWRWRLGVEDRYHYRFWGQVIRWMAYQRTLASGERMRLAYLPETVSVGDSVTFRASVMNRNGNPATQRELDLQVKPPSGASESIRLFRASDEWGVYRGTYDSVNAPGSYDVQLDHPEEDRSLNLSFTVGGRAGETAGKPARPDWLRELASIGGGRTFESGEPVIDLVRELNRISPADQTLRRIQWWHQPIVLLTMITMMGFFWWSRRWAGGI